MCVVVYVSQWAGKLPTHAIKSYTHKLDVLDSFIAIHTFRMYGTYVYA